MQFFIKLLLANAIIVACVFLGKRHPTLSGLIATMPLTSLIVLLWLHSDYPGNYPLLTDYTTGVLWGIIPTILFFAALYIFFRRQLPFPVIIGAGFLVWLAGAIVHQWLLHGK
jgi:uncharacterized membrane protein (GlpM family)